MTCIDLQMLVNTRNMTFGRWVRDRRIQLGLTLREFSIRAKVDVSTVWRWEHERNLPPDHLWAQIAEAAQVSLDEIRRLVTRKAVA